MSCGICMSEYVKPGCEVYSTTCGHVYHEMCLRGWVSKNKSCPACRKKCEENTLIHLFFDVEEKADDNAAADNESLLLAKIKSLIEEANSSNMVVLQETFGVSVARLNEAESQNKALQRENAEIKNRIETLETNGKLKSLSASDKDKLIESLQKEISDLKAQRSATMREMVSFRQQIEQLKVKARGAEARPETNGVQHKQSLTLKFDNSSDKLIIE